VAESERKARHYKSDKRELRDRLESEVSLLKEGAMLAQDSQQKTQMDLNQLLIDKETVEATARHQTELIETLEREKVELKQQLQTALTSNRQLTDHVTQLEIKASQIPKLTMDKQSLEQTLQDVVGESLKTTVEGSGGSFSSDEEIPMDAGSRVPLPWVLTTMGTLALKLQERQHALEAVYSIHEQLLRDVNDSSSSSLSAGSVTAGSESEPDKTVRALLQTAHSNLLEGMHRDRVFQAETAKECESLQTRSYEIQQNLFAKRQAKKRHLRRLAFAFQNWRRLYTLKTVHTPLFLSVSPIPYVPSRLEYCRCALLF